MGLRMTPLALFVSMAFSAALAWAQLADVPTTLPRLTAQSCANERQLKGNPLASTETSVWFINRRATAITVYSVDPVGLRHLAITLQPGTDARQSTSLGTPWIVADSQGQCMAVFQPSREAAQAVIPDSPAAVTGTGGGVYKPGNGVTIPQVVREVKPHYTAAALRAQLQGSVWIEAVVLPDGTVGNARVIRSLDKTYGLDEEAMTAAKQWRFRPGTRNGEPVAVQVILQLDFSIKPPGAGRE